MPSASLYLPSGSTRWLGRLGLVVVALVAGVIAQIAIAQIEANTRRDLGDRLASPPPTVGS